MKRITKYLSMYVSLSVWCVFINAFDMHLRFPENPKITIITSVFKSDIFIRGFMENIVQQTIFNECELLLINANSPGHEEDIIKEFMEIYPNITYIKLDKDPGLYGVWNRGIKLARSPYVTNANTDDRVTFDCYSKHAQILDANPDIDLVYSDYYTTNVVNDTFANCKKLKHTTHPEFSPCYMQVCLPGMNPMWRVTLHQKHGYFNEDFKSAGDWEMWCRAVEGGSVFKKVHAITGLYYHNPSGLSSGHCYRQLIQKERKLIELLYANVLQSTPPKKRKKDDKKKYRDKKGTKDRKVKKRAITAT